MHCSEHLPSLVIGGQESDVERLSEQFDLGPVIQVQDTFEGFDVLMTQSVDAVVLCTERSSSEGIQLQSRLDRKPWCHFRRFLAVAPALRSAYRHYQTA